MSAFWKTCLMIWCWSAFVFGATLTGAALPQTDAPTRTLIAILNPDIGSQLDPVARFAIALTGAVTIGWSLTLMALVRATPNLGDGAAGLWRSVSYGLVAWYVIDSSLSIATGFGLNAVSNTLFLVAFLLAAWRSGVLRLRSA